MLTDIERIGEELNTMVVVKDAQYRVLKEFPTLRDPLGEEWHQTVRRAYSKHHREVEKLRQQADRTRDAVSLSLKIIFDEQPDVRSSFISLT